MVNKRTGGPPPLRAERGPGGEVLSGGQAALPLSVWRGGRGVRYYQADVL